VHKESKADIYLQILTLSLAEQTNKLMRRFEDRVLPDRIKEKI
jgi:solute carrier family 25 protein 34/35